jgi:hypothetical protein
MKRFPTPGVEFNISVVGGYVLYCDVGLIMIGTFSSVWTI